MDWSKEPLPSASTQRGFAYSIRHSSVTMKSSHLIIAALMLWVFMATYFFLNDDNNRATLCSSGEIQGRLLDIDMLWNIDHESKPAVVSKCIDPRKQSIEHLDELVTSWRSSSHKVCNELYTVFNLILNIEKRSGSLNITKEFRVKMLKWFGGNQDLVKQAELQTVIFLLNKWTFDSTIFNPIREKRPVSKPKGDSLSDLQYVEKLSKSSKKTCDFCEDTYKTNTSPDVYGRIESKHCYTASNAFKLDAFHTLVVYREHTPIHWTQDAMMDVFNTAMEWFKRVNHKNPGFIYPIIFWDLLPHASASQVHPHIHLMITDTGYYGLQEEWRQVSKQYNQKLGRTYFDDIVSLHDVLGLASKYGTASAFSNLTPKKDHEVVITSHSANEDFFKMIYFVLRAYIEDMEKLCFSMAIALPPMIPHNQLDAYEIPAFARVVTRGTVSEVRSDVSSMELFAASNVNIDPFKSAKIIRASVEKRQNF